MNDEVKTYVEGKREPHIVIEMPMPMDCETCPLNDEYAECALLGEFVAKCGRLPDCPLSEVEG